jgi:hypothetical protein
VIIPVGQVHLVEGVAAVGGLVEVNIHDVESVRVLGVGKNVHVVPGALGVTVVRVDQFPLVAAVVGAVEATILGFNQGVDPLGVGGHSHAGFAPGAFGQAVPG